MGTDYLFILKIKFVPNVRIIALITNRKKTAEETPAVLTIKTGVC